MIISSLVVRSVSSHLPLFPPPSPSSSSPFVSFSLSLPFPIFLYLFPFSLPSSSPPLFSPLSLFSLPFTLSLSTLSYILPPPPSLSLPLLPTPTHRPPLHIPHGVTPARAPTCSNTAQPTPVQRRVPGGMGVGRGRRRDVGGHEQRLIWRMTTMTCRNSR